MNKVSVVTSMYNRGTEVLAVIDNLLFPSLLNNGNSEMELIIIDDRSPLAIGTWNIVEKWLHNLRRKFGNVIFVRNNANLGFAKSFNKGISMAGGETIIIANDDLYFPSGSIKKLAETLNEPENYLIAGPITNADSAWSFQYCRQAPLIEAYSSKEIARLEKFSVWLGDKMNGQRITTDNICGFCFAAKVDLLRVLGGFDERYAYGFFEDTDLIQQIAKRYGQKRIAIALDVFVNHGGVNGSSKTVSQEPLKMVYALMANGIKYANRWGYGKLFKRIIYGTKSNFGKGTISELLPEKIDL